MTKGTDNYPKTIVETTRLLNDYKVPARQQRVRDLDNDGVAFVQTGPKKPGANATTMRTKTAITMMMKTTMRKTTMITTTTKKTPPMTTPTRERRWSRTKKKSSKIQECAGLDVTTEG